MKERLKFLASSDDDKNNNDLNPLTLVTAELSGLQQEDEAPDK